MQGKIFKTIFCVSSPRESAARRRTPSVLLKLQARTPNLQPLKHGAVHSAMVSSPVNPCAVQRLEDLPAQKRCVGAALCLSHPPLLDARTSLPACSSRSPEMPQTHGSKIVFLLST